jgi:integrase
MARSIHRLSARECKTLGQGLHADGGNLYLQVTPTGVRSWILRYQRAGKTRDMGLGPLHTVSLADARQTATEARKAILRGDDPLAHRKATQTAKAAVPTFMKAAAEYIESHKAGWKNAKHADQWTNTLKAYAHPKIGDMAVDRIGTDDVMRVLQPIWTSKTETATRVRQRIEQVLGWCAARKLRPAENPATWRGHLDKLLPKPTKVAKVKHFPAMPYPELPAFMTLLRKRAGSDARALELTILSAARTSMTVGAKWSEIEGDAWRVPAERMKSGKEHVVPLAPAAVRLLKHLPRERKSVYLFRGQRQVHMSTGAMDALLARMKFDHFTVHGFRSTFKDWATEKTHFPNIVSEAALAHVVGDKVEAAYRRGELLEKRRELMEAWAKYCGY